MVIRVLATTPVVPSPGRGRDFTLSQEYGSALGGSRSPTPSVSRELFEGVRRPKRGESNVAASNVRSRMVKRKAILVQSWTGPEGARW
jgi:hypothetical protein